MTTNVLRINSGANHAASVSRPLADRLIAGFAATGPVAVTELELSHGMPLVDHAWMGGVNGGVTDDPSTAARERSDAYIQQVEAADVLVITAPIYNFSIPAALKAWIDQVARAGKTFRYTGPGQIEGLLTGKKAYIVITAGGVALGSDADFSSPYLRHVLGFVGITDLHIIDATGLALDPEGSVAAARAQIDQLLAV